MFFGLAEKTVPWSWKRHVLGAGFSKFAIAMSAPWIRSRTAPALPDRCVYGVSQPNGEQLRQRPVMSTVPPLNGKSVPARLPPIARETPRSSRMSPPATMVQARAGSYPGSPPGAGQARRERPSRQRLDAVHAEQRLRAPVDRAHGRRDVARAEEAELGAMAREAGGERLGRGNRPEAVAERAALEVQRLQDRVGVRVDEDEAVVVAATVGDRAHVRRADAVRGRPEGHDGDDRDVAGDRRRRAGRDGGRGGGG